MTILQTKQKRGKAIIPQTIVQHEYSQESSFNKRLDQWLKKKTAAANMFFR